MSEVFTRTFRVRYAEVEANGWVSPASYLRYLVETAYDWGAAYRLGMEDSQAMGLVWVIRETDMHFIHPLQFGDVFDFSIWMIQWRRVRGTRGFELRRKGESELIAYGIQQIVTLDEKTGRPISLTDGLIDKFYLDNPKTFPSEKFPKLEPPDVGFFKYCSRVQWPDMDLFNHVNNAKYLDYVQEAGLRVFDMAGWPPNRLRERELAFNTRHIQVQYQAPAVWGEQFDIIVWPGAWGKIGGRWFVSLNRVPDRIGIAGFVLDWNLVHPKTFQPEELPDDLIESLQNIFSKG